MLGLMTLSDQPSFQGLPSPLTHLEAMYQTPGHELALDTCALGRMKAYATYL